MKKQFLILSMSLVVLLFAACNSKMDKKESQNESIPTVETSESLVQHSNNSKQKIAFNFNRENFENDATLADELEGTHVGENNWLIEFVGFDGDSFREVKLNFNLLDFKLTTGKINTLCTISLIGFDDLESSDEELTSSEYVFL